jgi:hypothetical protein
MEYKKKKKKKKKPCHFWTSSGSLFWGNVASHDTTPTREFIIVVIVVDVGIYILNLSICNLKLLDRSRRESIYTPRKHLYLQWHDDSRAVDSSVSKLIQSSVDSF